MAFSDQWYGLISVRTNPHPLIKRVIHRRAKVGNKCIAYGPFKQ